MTTPDLAAAYNEIRDEFQGAIDRYLEHLAAQLGVDPSPVPATPAPAHAHVFDGLIVGEQRGGIAQ